MRVTTESILSFLTISVSAFLFYLALGSTVNTLEIVTGVISAVVVGILFAGIAFETHPSFSRTPIRVMRSLLFVPYLLWEIMKANVTMAYLILHPDLPINAHFERYETPETGPLELSALATSITLTPGTLVTDVHDDEFEVHVLTDAAWDSLLRGTLERAVGFVFIGQSSFDSRTPRERMGVNTTAGDSDSDD